jgi:hypothetical protein
MIDVLLGLVLMVLGVGGVILWALWRERHK